MLGDLTRHALAHVIKESIDFKFFLVKSRSFPSNHNILYQWKMIGIKAPWSSPLFFFCITVKIKTMNMYIYIYIYKLNVLSPKDEFHLEPNYFNWIIWDFWIKCALKILTKLYCLPALRSRIDIKTVWGDHSIYAHVLFGVVNSISRNIHFLILQTYYFEVLNNFPLNTSIWVPHVPVRDIPLHSSLSFKGLPKSRFNLRLLLHCALKYYHIVCPTIR